MPALEYILKFFLVGLLIIHGLIHLLGGFSELRIARFDNLSGQTLFPVPKFLRFALGVLWLLTTALFLVSAVGLIAKDIWAKDLAIFAAAASQILIVVWWQDAKMGTLINVLILLLLHFI